MKNSGHCSHHFGPSSSINNYAATLQKVIAALRTRQKIICECCGGIGHKSDACIIRGPKCLSPSLRRKMNQFNALHGNSPKEPPREWNSQPPSAHFKSRSSPSRTNPVVSAIMGKLNHHNIDNVILLQTFQLSLAMTPFQIQTPLLSNQLMMMK